MELLPNGTINDKMEDLPGLEAWERNGMEGEGRCRIVREEGL
jgi:hypothetical protein